MRQIFQWARRSNEHAVCNARLATTALSQARVERDAVEYFLAAYAEGRAAPNRSA
jgi:hypothetical protein